MMAQRCCHVALFYIVMSYIKAQKAFEKLKKAEAIYAPVIFSAASGWGKSAAVSYFYRRKNVLVLQCRSGFIKEQPPIQSIRQSIVIVEDMQYLANDRAIRYLQSLLHIEGMQVVMVTRGAVPGYIAGEEMDIGLVRITEKDLALGEAEVGAFLADCGVEVDPFLLPAIAEASRGYPQAVRCYANHLEQGEPYSPAMQEAVWEDLFHIWDSGVYRHYTDWFQDFALELCRYDSFTLEMAVYMTGSQRVTEVIEYSREQMNQLFCLPEGSYAFRPEIRRFYCWKQERLWTDAAIRENARRGARFYEMKGDLPNALLHYEKAGATQCVKDILIRNMRENPGTGQYVELKDYYFDLPEEEIEESPLLMAGMCMLYSLVLQPEKSEQWYERIAAYERMPEHPRERRREARIRLAYLDIALPHRGAKGIIPIFRKVFVDFFSQGMMLPEMSVTGNLPSLMSGGLDFSEWSKSDTQIAKFMRVPVEKLVGQYSKGLVTIALAESGFEKNRMSSYEVLTRCNDGYESAAHGGKIEMCFAAVGVLSRLHIIEGQHPSARRICESFAEKVRKTEGARQLLPNIEAFEAWLSLFSGFTDRARIFMEQVPDAFSDFSILDRYRQMVKLRCLIAAQKLEEAYSLAGFLHGYFVSYERTFNRIENEVLQAVILYRMGDAHWKECLLQMLERASGYHFVRVVSMEGAAVYPLLKECKALFKKRDGEGEYFWEVLEEAQKQALAYPDYLRFIPQEKVVLTKRETQVLSMLCAGLSMDEISEQCGISYGGLKKHNRNIYRKLGAKNRTEAERRAAQLGLVHRNAQLNGFGYDATDRIWGGYMNEVETRGEDQGAGWDVAGTWGEPQEDQG